MKNILNIILLLFVMATNAFAATDNIALYVKDIVVDWSGGGGTKDVENNTFNYNKVCQ